MILMSYIVTRATTLNFWQARPTHQWRHAAALHSANYRQGLGLGGLASRGGPGPGLKFGDENFGVEMTCNLFKAELSMDMNCWIPNSILKSGNYTLWTLHQLALKMRVGRISFEFISLTKPISLTMCK